MARSQIDVGDPAPPLTLFDAYDRPWRLDEQPGPVVLIFHRHIH